MKIHLFCFLLIISSALFGSEYDQISEPLPFDPHGWFSRDNAAHLELLIQKKNVHTVIEVGSWLGSSTRFIAERLPQDGVVYAVDTWEGSPEHQSQTYVGKLPSLYAQFLSNIMHVHLEDRVHPIRSTSLEAAKAIQEKADLIFIDAAHDTESVYNDVKAWYPHLNENGVICGDDWTWPSVRAGVQKAAEELGATIKSGDSFWYFVPDDGSLSSVQLAFLNAKGKLRRNVRPWLFWRKGGESTSSTQDELTSFLAEQIQEDTKGRSLSINDLEATWNELKGSEHYARFKWSGGNFTVSTLYPSDHPRYVVITKAMEKIIFQPGFPDFDCILCFGDCVESNNFSAPVFAFAKTKDAHNVILMPDHEALNPIDRKYISDVVMQTGAVIPWEQKEEKVFWRGATTGRHPTVEEIEHEVWSQAPRFCLVKLSEKFPQLVDAQFSCNTNIEKDSALFAAFPAIEPLHPKKHLPYKYQIDIDGNSCCYSRTYWTLLSNCLLLKQTSDNIQWFYKGLQPYTHFVPVAHDLHDLFEQISWCQAHDDQAQAIAKRGTEFALSHLQYETNLQYFAALLKAYAHTLDFVPTAQKGDRKAICSLKSDLKFQCKARLHKILKHQPISQISFNLR